MAALPWLVWLFDLFYPTGLVSCYCRPITVYHIEGGSLEPVVTYGEELGKGGNQPINLL